jgi:dihydrolipoamide dehydrogenase
MCFYHIKICSGGKIMKIVVIGGGPGGRTAAIEAAELGEDVTLIERNKIGGKCLNEGCMVICGLNDVAKFIRNTERFNDIGITNLNPEIDFKKVTDGIKETTGKIRHVITNETQKAGVNVVMGDAKLEEGFVSVGSSTYEYDKLIISTGSHPFIPPIKGAETAKTYKNILEIEELPEKMIIVGSGVIASEFAGIFSAMGTEVHILCRNKFLKILDDDIKSYVVQKLLKDVKIHENVAVTEIRPDGLSTTNGKMEGLVLLAVGLVPNSDIAKDMVDTTNKGEIIVDKMMKTSHINIYAAGDVVGGITNTPVSRMEGVVAARNACGIAAEVDYRFIPSSISLQYDVGFLSSDDPEGVEGRIPGSAGPGAFWDVLRGETGITKATVDVEKGEIKSLFSISPSARTNMAYMSKLLRDGYETYDFDNFVETHPSTDAVYKLLRFFSRFG